MNRLKIEIPNKIEISSANYGEKIILRLKKLEGYIEHKMDRAALELIEDVLIEIQNRKLPDLKVCLLLKKERILVFQNDYKKAYETSLDLLQKTTDTPDKALRSQILNNHGYINMELGNYPVALKHFFESLKLREQLNRKESVSVSLNNIGLLYRKQKNYDKALEYYQKTLQCYDETSNEEKLRRVLNNIGNIYLEKGELEKAFLFFNKVYQLAIESKDKAYQAFSLANVAKIEVHQGNLNQALEDFKKAIHFLDELKMKNKKGVVYNYMCDCLLKLNRPKEALKFGEKALEINQECSAKGEIAESYYKLFETYQLNKDYEKALHYHIKCNELQVELFSAEKVNAIKNLELAYEMEKNNQALQQLDKEKRLLKRINEELKQFASVASHDMKEPLRMISSFSNLLERRLKNELDQESMEYLEIIKNNAKRMIDLLEDLLIYAKAGYDHIDLTNVDLNKVLFKLEDSLRLLINESGGSINYDTLPVIKTQETLIYQVFQNIIANALKFRKPKVPPIIEIKTEDQKTYHYITIKDNGIGIDQDDLKRIFHVFQRLHPQAHYKGSGIGLATCKKIIAHFGGKIWVTSIAGEGSTVHFTLKKSIA